MNAGPLVSKFNRKHLRLELILFLLFALSFVSMYVTHSKPSLVAKLVLAGIAFLVALCIWAFCLKKITLVGNELEVKRVCLPFLKRFYRLAEFDSYVVEEQNVDETLHLLSQGRRLVSLSSKTYENYLWKFSLSFKERRGRRCGSCAKGRWPSAYHSLSMRTTMCWNTPSASHHPGAFQ